MKSEEFDKNEEERSLQFNLKLRSFIGVYKRYNIYPLCQWTTKFIPKRVICESFSTRLVRTRQNPFILAESKHQLSRVIALRLEFIHREASSISPRTFEMLLDLSARNRSATFRNNDVLFLRPKKRLN